jgi:hypothetical protein
MRLFIFLSIFAILVSCAQVPEPASHFLTYQKKLQASKHWDRMAKKVANNVQMALESQSELDTITSTSGKGPVFIQDHDNSQFGSTMHTLITSELFNKGINVSQNRKSRYKLNWNVQLVTREANRINKSGLLAFILIEIPQSIFFGENDSKEYKPHSEAVITFKLKKDDINLFRDTKIYYVNDEDNNHYWDIAEYADQESTKSATFTIVNK